MINTITPNSLRRPWTNEEYDELKRVYPLMSVDDVAKLFGRSKSSIVCKAHDLGVLSKWTLIENQNRVLRSNGVQECNRCHKIKPIDAFYVYNGVPHDNCCKECRSTQAVKSLEDRLSRLLIGNKHRKNLTLEMLLTKWYKQDGKCFYSGFPMGLIGKRDDVVSLDRVDPPQGYTDQNTVLCCYRVNMMKHTASTKDFVIWCKRISALHP